MWNPTPPISRASAPVRSVAVLGALLLIAACGPPAPVVQGTVRAVGAGTMSVQDENQLSAPPLVLDLSRAEIGNAPRVGDVVRVVYRPEAGSNRALAVMNLTRQPGAEGASR